MKKLIPLLFTMVLILSACSAEKRALRHCAKCPEKNWITLHDTVMERIRDTVVKIESDTANFWALIACSEQNEVFIREIKNLSTQGIKTVFSFKHDTLYYQATLDSGKVYIKLKEKFEKKTTQVVKIVTKEIIINKIYGWQWIIATLIGIILFILGFVTKKYLFPVK